MTAPQSRSHTQPAWIDTWPSADREAFLEATRPGSLFRPGGAGADWRPATRDHYTRAYGYWLAFLRNQGIALDDVAPPDRVTPERIELYVRCRADRLALSTLASQLAALYSFLLAVWPSRDWRWLRDIERGLQRQAMPVRNKEARLVQAHELLGLGETLMLHADERPPASGSYVGDEDPSMEFRDGLIIATLCLRPLRRRNFLGLALGRTLRHEAGGWLIDIPGDETKNWTRLLQPFPVALEEYLERYLAIHRPRLAAMAGGGPGGDLARAPGDLLWLSRWGRPLSVGALKAIIARRTTARFGHALHPHLFRDCAATSLANAQPNDMHLAANLLGHRSFATTQRYYMAAGQRWALTELQAEITRVRRRGARAASEIARGERVE
jgi:integrase/recombinase XerD